MKKHSPLPWDADGGSLQIIDPYDNVVANCETEVFASERRRNAEFIAFACNSHYQLISALRRLSEVATLITTLKRTNFALRNDVWQELKAANEAADVAIAEVEKSEKNLLSA